MIELLLVFYITGVFMAYGFLKGVEASTKSEIDTEVMLKESAKSWYFVGFQIAEMLTDLGDLVGKTSNKISETQKSIEKLKEISEKK